MLSLQTGGGTRRPNPRQRSCTVARLDFSKIGHGFSTICDRRDFAGRIFARQRAAELGLPDDPRIWSADAILMSLLLYGDDLPGDFVLGSDAVQRVQKTRMEDPMGIPSSERRERYGEIAEAVLAGTPVGSSAGGEQPKFTARIREEGVFKNVIVKISPPRDTEAGQRWTDLLLAEHLAAEQLARNGMSASETQWIEGARRVSLEVKRFDRVGSHGRRGVVSLLAVDAELHGALDTWPKAADRLRRSGWLSEADALRLKVLWWFGKLIANTDLHFGNVSLFLNDAPPLELAPAYDMLPMGLAPRGQGEIVPYPAIMEPPPPEAADAWLRAAGMASAYWIALGSDQRASRDFAAQAKKYAFAIRQLVDRFDPNTS